MGVIATLIGTLVSLSYMDYCEQVRGAKGKGHGWSAIPGVVLAASKEDLS
jgi:hypothetical protein